MKIKIINANYQPLTNQSIGLKVKDKETLSLKTNERGEVQLDDKFAGQLIATESPNPSQWITANEGASITLQKETETTFK